MKALIIGLAAVSALAQAPRKQTFVGTITDEMCGNAGHAGMRMGPTDAECAVACVNSHGVRYALLVGKTAYLLSDQRTPESYAGKKVRVVGTLDQKTNTIAVMSMAASK